MKQLGKVISEADKEKLQQVAYDHYIKTGYPYFDYTPYELWLLFFELKYSESKIEKGKKGLLKDLFTHVSVDSAGNDIPYFFNRHIFESKVEKGCSPFEAMQDEKKIKKCVRLCLDFDFGFGDDGIRRTSKLVNGTQMCSNYRPTAAKAIYNMFKAERILDPCSGYGGRLLGYLASNHGSLYVGVDPSERTCKANQAMADFFSIENKEVKLIQSPFEDVPYRELGRFDLAFTSPPYFSKEVYDDNPNQSRERYKEYDSWMTNFWKKSITTVHKCLPKDKYFLINIQDVNLKGKRYELVKPTIDICKEIGFIHENTLMMKFPGFGSNLDKVKTEPILVFKKS